MSRADRRTTTRKHEREFDAAVWRGRSSLRGSPRNMSSQQTGASAKPERPRHPAVPKLQLGNKTQRSTNMNIGVTGAGPTGGPGLVSKMIQSSTSTTTSPGFCAKRPRPPRRSLVTTTKRRAVSYSSLRPVDVGSGARGTMSKPDRSRPESARARSGRCMTTRSRSYRTA